MMTLTRRDLLASGAAAGAMLAAGPLFAQPGTPYPVYGKVERLDPALDALIDADAVVEQIAEGFNWIEGPCWIGGPDGYLLASDVRDNRIFRWTPRTGAQVWVDPSGFEGPNPDLAEAGTNGLFTSKGRLLVADSGNRWLGTIDLQTKKKTPLVARFEGKRFNSPNDICVSPVTGAIYFTDPPHGLLNKNESKVREMDYNGVFKLTADGKLSLVGKFDMPNGIGISPDGRTLYHTDRAIGWVAHTLDRNGNSTGYKPFIERASLAGGDGLKIDSNGNMWASGRDGINVITPAGKRIGVIRGNDVMSNCEIGADGHLYISTNHRLTRVRVKARKLRVA